MARHTFAFNGGEKLTTMGASWFVSYCYHEKLDKTHKNWNEITTGKSRISVYSNTTEMHGYWLEQVLKMDDGRLKRNKLGLSPVVIKDMAAKLLSVIK